MNANLGAGGRPVGPPAGADLFLQYREERLGDGIVETRAGPAHALPQLQPA
ncbi:hypothetical protein ABZX62_26765 [Streptomyces flavidovirens]|uniref:hypothetical protein n=1 Tax=Streptomyces flavidovirens TaxID=67298 RepID=UPI0033A63B25